MKNEAGLRHTESETARFASWRQRRRFIRAKRMLHVCEANETGYWLELLYKTNYIGEEQYNFLGSKCKSLRAMLVSSINTAKNNNKYFSKTYTNFFLPFGAMLLPNRKEVFYAFYLILERWRFPLTQKTAPPLPRRIALL